MANLAPNTQVIVVADDPIEAGMLALDLVQAGAQAQAVRDLESTLQQVQEIRARGTATIAVVAAFRELAQAVALWESLAGSPPTPAFVAVVLRNQHDAAARYIETAGWSGVAVRPVGADDLVGLIAQAAGRQPEASHDLRVGALEDENLLDILSGLIDRIPRPGAGKTALIRLESQGRTGTVALVDGDLVHAELDGEFGRHSLERLATWRHGIFSVQQAAWNGPATLSGSALGLFAVAQEYARRLEEARQSLPYTDNVCAVRWERVRPLPVVAEALFRRIAAGQVLADALTGEGDDELEAFAALEARIRRGAVVPVVDPAPGRMPTQGTVAAPAQPAEAPGPDQAAPEPAVSSLLAGMRERPPSGHRAVSATWSPAAAGTVVDAPQMPERRHSHATTNAYRLGADGKPLAMPYENADALSRLPDAGANPVRRAPTPLQTSANSTPPRRQPSSLLSAGALPPRRPGPVTGWFGVNPNDSGGFEAEPLTDGRRSLTTGKAPKVADNDRLVAGLQASAKTSQALLDTATSARPYTWIPAAEFDEELDAPPPQPKMAALLKPKNWPWIGLAVATLAVVIWLVVPRAPAQAPVDPAMQAYEAAVDLLDKDHTDAARTALEKLANKPNPVAEVLLHLAVLDIEARRFDTARLRLDAYLAHPAARHVDRAKRLYGHVFGAATANGG